MDKLILYSFGIVSCITGVYFIVKRIGNDQIEIDTKLFGKIKTAQSGIVFFVIGACCIITAATVLKNDPSPEIAKQNKSDNQPPKIDTNESDLINQSQSKNALKSSVDDIALINRFREDNIKYKEFFDEKISLTQDLINALNKEKDFDNFLDLINQFNSNINDENFKFKNFKEININDVNLFIKSKFLLQYYQPQKEKLDALTRKSSKMELEGKEIIKNLQAAGSQNNTKEYRKYSIDWANNLLSYYNLNNQILNVQLEIIRSATNQ